MNDQSEILIVVNENDDVLDYLPRSEVHAKKLLHRTISVLVFNDKGQVLLQKRSVKKDSNPGKWSNAAGGHVNKGLTYDQAAEIEIKEELSINDSPQFVKKIIINDPKHKTLTQLYKIKSNGPFQLNPEETDELRFFSEEELPRIFNNLSESSKITLKEYGFLK